tara:strand:- start:497 stop:2119 length:1623 start_codon:yes stop_codon:yes gene_type:complete
MCYNLAGSFECVLQASAWYTEGEGGWTGLDGNLVPFNSSDYENTASATYALVSAGNVVGDQGDLLGAFLNGELRGIAEAVTLPVSDAFGQWSGQSEFLLYSFGNAEDTGETYTLRYFDASDGTDFELSETFVFTPDAVYGTAFSPVVINLSITVNIDLPAGSWTWFSVDALTDDMTPSNVLSSVDVANAYVKSTSGFSTYVSGYGWYGSVNSLAIGDGYMLNLPGDDDKVLSYSGSPVSPSDYPVSVSTGWNWIGTVAPLNLDISSALATLDATLVENDYIKSSSSFSTYYEGFGWYGGITSIDRNNMYKLKVANDGTIVYPTNSTLSRVSAAYSNVIEEAFDYTVFENNGSIVVDIAIDGVEVNEGDILTAYVDGEIRGQVNPQLFPLTNEYLFGMMVYGDENSDNIEFEYYNYISGKTYTLNHDLIGFEANMIVGDYLDPYTMDDSSDIMPSSYALDKAYPNPFNPTTTVGYSLSNPAYVDITVYDITGRVVESLVGEFKSEGSHKVVWNASNMASGVYFVQLNVDGFTDTQKLMLIK